MEKYIEKLDYLLKYISDYYVYMITGKANAIHSFEDACKYSGTAYDIFKNNYCQFVQLQSWNENKYFVSEGGMGHTKDSVLYRTFNYHRGIKFNISEWNFNQKLLKAKA